MATLGALLPQSLEVDETVLDQVIVKDVAPDCLHCLRAFDVHLMVDSELRTPIAHPVDLLFVVHLLVLVSSVERALQVFKALANNS
mmetsp:Transcript_33017/g.43492  ORF Transcript_33017/g.43492 Transcript_33017/m.43492 type:complete len:86 (+) Transcript_33017:3148-3405(+)